MMGRDVNLWPERKKENVSHSAVSYSFVTPWTIAQQAPLSMGFSRQEYWSGLPFPSPGDLPNSGLKPRSPALQADSLPAEPQGKPINKHISIQINLCFVYIVINSFCPNTIL